MKIQALTTFLDGRDRFEAGDIRTVPDADGARFCANGWAADVTGQTATGTAAAGTADLNIHTSKLGVTSTTKGA